MSRLIIRDSERHEITLPARFRVGAEHVSVVRLAAGAPSRDGWVEADLMDLSRTGFGMVSPVFLPRLTLIQVQIFNVGQDTESEPLVDGVVRVRRTIMTDGRPAYLLGVSVDQSHTVIARQIGALIDRCNDAARSAEQSYGEAFGGDDA